MTVEAAQRYETGISENNLKHWGMLEAVKELVQNVVYAKTILRNDISITHDGTKAILTNTPSGFTKGKLLIGESEQANVAGAPGQYGEGMKMAMAVARRCGKGCVVHTNGFRVVPELEPSGLDKDVNVLVFYVMDTDENNGTKFEIACDKATLDEAVAYFAVLNGVKEDDTKQHSIVENVIDTVFVNGVKVADVHSILSYNFTTPELMNRDRTTVNMELLKKCVSQMVGRILDVNLAGAILQSVIQDDTLLEAQSGISYLGNTDVWKQACAKVLGTKLAIATGGDCDTKARYHKFKVLTNVPYNWKYFFNTSLGIPYTDELEEVAQRPKNLHRKPSTDETFILGWAKRLVKLYYGDYGTVKVSEKVYDQFGNECLGLYERSTDTTWLARHILSNKEQTFKTLLHETIHRVSGASDNTALFTREWEKACWGILTRGKGDI